MTLNGVFTYSGTAKSFQVNPIMPETGKVTDFKFGRYIHRVHPNKNPFNIFKKRERGHIQGLRKVCKYPLLSQERGHIQALPLEMCGTVKLLINIY